MLPPHFDYRDDVSAPSTPSGSGSLPTPRHAPAIAGPSGSPASPRHNLSKRRSDSQLAVPSTSVLSPDQPSITETGDTRERSASHSELPSTTPLSTTDTTHSR